MNDPLLITCIVLSAICAFCALMGNHYEHK